MNSQQINSCKSMIAELQNEFTSLIQSRLGISVHEHQMSELLKCLYNGCIKFQCTPEMLLSSLSQCTDQSPMIDYLVSCVTVGETYFFRDKSQMSLLNNILLPSLIAKKRRENNLSLRIWSAGCSSGEELYSVCIMLNELLPDFDKWSLSLLGTDINTVALHKAIDGYYTEWSMRSITPELKSKYFTYENSKYLINKLIREKTCFDYLNLNDDSFPSIYSSTNAQDIILCRNVLIYFDTPHVMQLMKKFSSSIVPGGILILGASDPVEMKMTDLVMDHKQAIYFYKPTEEMLKKVEPIIEKKMTSPVNSIAPIKIKTPVEAGKKSIALRSKIEHEQLLKLKQEDKWQEIISLVSNRNEDEVLTAETMHLYALSLANIGKLELAVKTLEECIKMEPTNKLTYFSYALTLSELNKLDAAEKALRQSIYLDNQFVIGHYHLGLLLLRNKQSSNALRCIRNAINIAKKMPAELTVDGSTSLTYGRLHEILVYELDMHSTIKGSYDAHQNESKEQT